MKIPMVSPHGSSSEVGVLSQRLGFFQKKYWDVGHRILVLNIAFGAIVWKHHVSMDSQEMLGETHKSRGGYYHAEISSQGSWPLYVEAWEKFTVVRLESSCFSLFRNRNMSWCRPFQKIHQSYRIKHEKLLVFAILSCKWACYAAPLPCEDTLKYLLY